MDGAGHLGLLTWLGLDFSVSLLGLETQAKRGSVREVKSDHALPWHYITDQWILSHKCGLKRLQSEAAISIPAREI